MERLVDFKGLAADAGDPRWGRLRPYEVSAMLNAAVDRFEPASALSLLEFVAQLSDRGCGRLAAPFMSELLLKAVTLAGTPEERNRNRRFISERMVPALLRSLAMGDSERTAAAEAGAERPDR